jgi:hypothetical protein
LDPERQQLLNRIQIWGFVVAGVGALLTLPAVGVLFGLAAVALTYRTPLPGARYAGIVVALVCLVVAVSGLGPGDGGGLID